MYILTSYIKPKYNLLRNVLFLVYVLTYSYLSYPTDFHPFFHLWSSGSIQFVL